MRSRLQGYALSQISVGGGQSSYTPTHYVAPFASVGGAANDYADLGATAWTNATNSGTPTTLGTAMARATAGNKVRCAAGVYVGVHTGDRFDPVFKPANDGTAGNQIVFFAVNPAANNFGSTSLYSELRHNGVDGATSPVMGSDFKNYLVFDGFYAKFTTAFPAPSGGTFLAHGGTGAEFRRIAVDCDGTVSGPSGYSNQAIWCGSAASVRIADCWFEGNTGAHKNECHIQFYGCDDPIVEHCTHNCVTDGWSIFVKGTEPGFNTNAIIRYNRISGGGMAVGNCDGGVVHNNLLTASGAGNLWSQFWYYPDMADVHVYNNTMVSSGTQGSGFIYHYQDGNLVGTQSRVYDNIVVSDGSSAYLQMFNSAPWGESISIGGDANQVSQFDVLDGNVYFPSGGTSRFTDGSGTASSGLAAWRSNLAAIGMATAARETGSVEADPLFVGGSDYRLQAGSPALSGIGGRTTTAGCYQTGSEEIGVRASPTY